MGRCGAHEGFSPLRLSGENWAEPCRGPRLPDSSSCRAQAGSQPCFSAATSALCEAAGGLRCSKSLRRLLERWPCHPER